MDPYRFAAPTAIPVEVTTETRDTANPSVTFASIPADGELIVLSFAARVSSAASFPTTPAGFTLQVARKSTFPTAVIYTRVASGEASATYAITTTNNVNSLVGYRFPSNCSVGPVEGRALNAAGSGLSAHPIAHRNFGVPDNGYVVVAVVRTALATATISNSYNLRNATSQYARNADRQYTVGGAAENASVTYSAVDSIHAMAVAVITPTPVTPPAAGTITIVSEEQRDSAASLSFTFATVPAAGELIVFLVSGLVGATITPPAGFNGVGTATSGSAKVWQYQKVAGAAETNVYAWTTTNATVSIRGYVLSSSLGTPHQTINNSNTVTAGTSLVVPAASVGLLIPANSLVLAGVAMVAAPGAVGSPTNSFVTEYTSEANRTQTASRMYGAQATLQTTTFSWATAQNACGLMAVFSP